ncbi:translation initiation factor IF-2-like isoform X2 [Choloepus didactylus]|uniref:translation initiation factor IF-2-like isoform X2 n=1 Tax=Choloepus didactylus TaxID=27675 RepID=UPI00189D96FA|nr:translation initiation factor IF-2-like isoform X2 [Choloepus didactylus]
MAGPLRASAAGRGRGAGASVGGTRPSPLSSGEPRGTVPASGHPAGPAGDFTQTASQPAPQARPAAPPRPCPVLPPPTGPCLVLPSPRTPAPSCSAPSPSPHLVPRGRGGETPAVVRSADTDTELKATQIPETPRIARAPLLGGLLGRYGGCWPRIATDLEPAVTHWPFPPPQTHALRATHLKAQRHKAGGPGLTATEGRWTLEDDLRAHPWRSLGRDAHRGTAGRDDALQDRLQRPSHRAGRMGSSSHPLRGQREPRGPRLGLRPLPMPRPRAWGWARPPSGSPRARLVPGNASFLDGGQTWAQPRETACPPGAAPPLSSSKRHHTGLWGLRLSSTQDGESPARPGHIHHAPPCTGHAELTRTPTPRHAEGSGPGALSSATRRRPCETSAQQVQSVCSPARRPSPAPETSSGQFY